MDRLSNLPWVPCSILWEKLSARDLFALSRTNRLLHLNVEPFLYRRHALRHEALGPSAVMWAVETAEKPELGVPEIQTAFVVLDKVRQFCHIDSDALGLSYRPKDDKGLGLYLDRNGHLRTDSVTALQFAAWRGLDAVIEWLLACGAGVDDVTASLSIKSIFLAVMNKQTSTALLLLLHGASPVMDTETCFADLWRRHINRVAGPQITLFHIACVMGNQMLAEHLLALGSPLPDPADVLLWYVDCLATDTIHKASAQEELAIILLLANETGFPHRAFNRLVQSGRWTGALAFLQAKNRLYEIPRAEATCFLKQICHRIASYGMGCGRRTCREGFWLICQLLDMGADPDVGHLLLDTRFREFPWLDTVLAPFLHWGMDVSSSPHALGLMCAYRPHCTSRQISPVHLLLQYDAAIDWSVVYVMFDGIPGLSDRKDDLHRLSWAHHIRHELLQYCRKIPSHQRSENVHEFLVRIGEISHRLKQRGMDLDDPDKCSTSKLDCYDSAFDRWRFRP